MTKMMWAFTPDIDHPKYGALETDEYDAGQVIGESVARKIFERHDKDYCLQYATLDWKKERDERGIENCEWDDAKKEERGQYWRLVYRYYPRKKA